MSEDTIFLRPQLTISKKKTISKVERSSLKVYPTRKLGDESQELEEEAPPCIYKPEPFHIQTVIF